MTRSALAAKQSASINSSSLEFEMSGAIHCERDPDEFFVFIDRLQGSSGIVADVVRPPFLSPKRQLHDGSLQGELVFIDFE